MSERVSLTVANLCTLLAQVVARVGAMNRELFGSLSPRAILGLMGGHGREKNGQEQICGVVLGGLGGSWVSWGSNADLGRTAGDCQAGRLWDVLVCNGNYN